MRRFRASRRITGRCGPPTVIVFQSTDPAVPGLYWVRSDGSGEAQRLTDGRFQERPYSFSPDGSAWLLTRSETVLAQRTFSLRLRRRCNAGRARGPARQGGAVPRNAVQERSCPRFRLTDGGWRISRMSRGSLKCTCDRSLGREDHRRFRPAEAYSRCGLATVANCFFRHRTEA